MCDETLLKTGKPTNIAMPITGKPYISAQAKGWKAIFPFGVTITRNKNRNPEAAIKAINIESP